MSDHDAAGDPIARLRERIEKARDHAELAKGFLHESGADPEAWLDEAIDYMSDALRAADALRVGLSLDPEPDLPETECTTAAMLRKVARQFETGNFIVKVESGIDGSEWVEALKDRAHRLEERAARVGPSLAESNEHIEQAAHDLMDDLTERDRFDRDYSTLSDERINDIESNIRLRIHQAVERVWATARALRAVKIERAARAVPAAGRDQKET